ncbi:MFS transporter [Brevibacillus daliensis]|uniref:MFS transporter n=1 Tax=Brevibacillus daliensis TaxID=2892995 RepID=UPI001E6110EF|nr:MFS transporter [Brevibacillus daliensis]
MLHNKSYVSLVSGEVIAGTGMWIGIVGNLKFLQQLIDSDFLKGLLLMVGLFVSLFFSPKAGEWIDRFSKKNVLLYATIIRCLAPTCMLVAIQYNSVTWMILSSIFVQLAATFYQPAAQASIPLLVPSNELLRANGFYVNASTLARIGGTAIGGILIGFMQLWTLYSITLVCYFILILLILPIRIGSQKSVGKAGKPDKMPFREVFSLLKSDRTLTLGLTNALVVSYFVGGSNLLVINFSEMLQTPGLMGWIYTAEGITALLAGVMVKRFFGKRNLVLSSTLFLFILAFSQISMAFSYHIVPLMLSYTVFGYCFGTVVPLTATIFQKQLPADARGRFFSFKTMLDRTWFLLSLAGTGLFLDLIGINYYLLLMGAVSLLVGIFSLQYSKRHALDVRQVTENTKAKMA